MAPKDKRTALSKAPGNKLAQNLQRVSPGVYRDQSGQLVRSKGGAPSPSVGAIEGAARGAGAAIGGGMPSLNPTQRMPRDISGARDMARQIGAGMRPPMGGGRGMLDGIGQGVGAGLGGGARGQMGPRPESGIERYLPGDNFGGGMGAGMQGQFADMMQRFQGPKDPQTMQAEYDAFRQQQDALQGANMGAGFAQGFGRGMGGSYEDMRGQASSAAMGAAQGMGRGFGDMAGAANSAAQGFGRGFGMGMGGPQPGLEDQARARAEAIARGDMVTMDYNPQREQMVNQFLGQMGRAPAMGSQMKQPGTVSGILQRGPMQRPNPFASMVGKKPMPL